MQTDDVKIQEELEDLSIQSCPFYIYVMRSMFGSARQLMATIRLLLDFHRSIALAWRPKVELLESDCS